MQHKRATRTVGDLVLFSMLGSLMYLSKLLMEGLPNIHLVGVLTVAITLVYRTRALIPLYVFVLLAGLFQGFSPWWTPYLYVWTVLWGATMLLPRRIPRRLRPVIYSLVCGLHGLLFGTLYAPVQALLFGLTAEGMLAWIAAGLTFDLIHAAGNFTLGLLILPLSELLFRLERRRSV